MGYTQDRNLTNSKPNPNPNLNPLMLNKGLVHSLIHSSEIHQPLKSPLFASKRI